MTNEEFKKRRIESGLTQKEFAFIIGRSESVIRRWETGIQPVPKFIDIIYKLGNFDLF